MKRVIILLLMVLLLVVSPLVGCSNSSDEVTNHIDLIGLVPQKANVVGKIDLKSIMEDKDLTDLYDEAEKDSDQPQTFKDALAQLKDEYDIDLKSFHEGVVFMDVSESSDEVEYFGFIIQGTFDKDDLIAAIQSGTETELTKINYKDYDLYYDEAEDMELAFLTDNVFAIGTMQTVKDVIDVKQGDAEALSGDMLDTYNKLGDGLIKVAMAMPRNMMDRELGESESQFPGDLSAFDDIESIGMVLSKDNELVALNTKLCCADIDSANIIEDSISILISYMGLIIAMSDKPEENQALSSLLDKIDVAKSGSCVDVGLEIALSDIEGLVKDFKDGFGGSFIEGFTEGFLGTSDADNYETDAQTVQLATATFYSDVHSGWRDVNGDDNSNNASSFGDNVWGDSDTSNTQIVQGHYYPTAIAEVSNHILTLSTSQFDPDNPGNPRIDAEGVAATDTMIQAHAIWMGLLVNDAGNYTRVGGTTDRWEVSPLDGDGSLYLNDVPESAAADANYNGDPGMVMGGNYCWVVGKNGYVYGVYMGSNGCWYNGFNGTYSGLGLSEQYKLQ